MEKKKITEEFVEFAWILHVTDHDKTPGGHWHQDADRNRDCQNKREKHPDKLQQPHPEGSLLIRIQQCHERILHPSHANIARLWHWKKSKDFYSIMNWIMAGMHFNIELLEEIETLRHHGNCASQSLKRWSFFLFFASSSICSACNWFSKQSRQRLKLKIIKYFFCW